jgi:hypothetical protein
MADYVLVGNIVQIAPDRFEALVSALAAPGQATELITPLVLRRHAPSRERARALRDKLLRQAGTQITAKGHRVVDVIEE